MSPDFLRRLRERRLVQWGLAYLAVAWLLLQALDLLGQNFLWPPLIVRVATVLFAVGFLAALVVAWYHGEKGQQRVTAREAMLLAVLAAGGGAGVWLVGRDAGAPPATAPARTGAATPGPGHADARAPAPAGEAAGSYAANGRAADEDAGGVAEPGSVAVLPFVNLSGDPSQEYFSDGLTEELLNELARVPQLRVAARTSSFGFKGRNAPVEEIGRQLRVVAVVEGSVRRDGDRIRVTAQLSHTSTGYRVWSESYDRELMGVFELQEELARAIAGALRVRLAAAGGRPTTSVLAHDRYLLGLHHWHRREVEQALAHFEQAVAADSTYALAWAGLALTHVVFPAHTRTPPRQAMPRALAAVGRALALDSALADAHVARALIAQDYEWDWPTADLAFRRALALNPNHATALQWYAAFLVTQRRLDEALALAERAASLDPLLPQMHNRLAQVRVARREYDAALDGLREAAETYPENRALWFHRTLHAVVLSFVEGRPRVDEGEIGRWAGLGRFDAAPWLTLLGAVADPAQRPRALRAVAQVQTGRGISDGHAAQLYCLLGDHDRALDLLDVFFEERSGAVSYIGTLPAFDALHDHPRFQRLLRELRLEL